NFTPYLTSYLRNSTGDPDLTYTDTLWVSTTQVAVDCLAMSFLGLLSTRVRTKLFLVIGVIFTAGSYFGSYWAVQKSFPWTVVTYGALGGLPHALFGPANINIAARWIPHRKGLIVGLVLAGYGSGAFAWNQLITWYINPDNLQPDIVMDGNSEKSKLMTPVNQDSLQDYAEEGQPEDSTDIQVGDGRKNAYGQTFITDDHFLSLVASCSAIANAACRPIWGAVADKIGCRMALIYAQCLLACLVATFVTCEVTGRVAYFVWVCGMFAAICGTFTTVSTLTLAVFGPKYFNSNLGLVDTQGVISAVLSAVVAGSLQDAFGWHGMFFCGFAFIFVGDADLGYTDTLWLAQTLSIAACVYMIPLGLISNHMPAKLYLLIGTLFTAASQFGTYWSVQTSFPVTVVTYGIVGGVPLAMLYPPTLRLAVTWAPADKMGFITGVIITGYGSGAFAWNQLTTWYINPHNLQPDVKVGEDVYYSQPEVLEKAYGQTFIADDRFLSLAVSFSGVANAVARPISGLLADKIGCRVH
ncbi:hypothetical protein BaRGS_00012782, partial [Batillaria attramentaria]